MREKLAVNKFGMALVVLYDDAMKVHNFYYYSLSNNIPDSDLLICTTKESKKVIPAFKELCKNLELVEVL